MDDELLKIIKDSVKSEIEDYTKSHCGVLDVDECENHSRNHQEVTIEISLWYKDSIFKED